MSLLSRHWARKYPISRTRTHHSSQLPTFRNWGECASCWDATAHDVQAAQEQGGSPAAAAAAGRLRSVGVHIVV